MVRVLFSLGGCLDTSAAFHRVEKGHSDVGEQAGGGGGGVL